MLDHRDMGYGYLVIPHIFYEQLNASYRFDEARLLEDIGVEALQDPIDEPFTLCECPCSPSTLLSAVRYLMMCGIPFVAEVVSDTGESNNTSITAYHKFTKTDCIVNSKNGKQQSIRGLFQHIEPNIFNKTIDIDLYKSNASMAVAIFQLSNSLKAVREYYEMHTI